MKHASDTDSIVAGEAVAGGAFTNGGVADTTEDTVQDLFQTAALLLGDQAEAIASVEAAVAGVPTDPCMEPEKTRRQSRALLVRIALERAIARNPQAFRADSHIAGPDVCFETDDLEVSGVSGEQWTQLVSGPGKPRLREWLERLSPESRVVFVLRAMLGKDSAGVAEELRQANSATVWSVEQVGQVFRGALCSLANSLVHTPLAH